MIGSRTWIVAIVLAWALLFTCLMAVLLYGCAPPATGLCRLSPGVQPTTIPVVLDDPRPPDDEIKAWKEIERAKP